MAIREYFGARYVPRFMGTYTASQQYEVLDVVDNGMGTSYILKKPAPAGSPVTNTTYWAIYGATSGAIINLQNQIDNINDTLGILNNKEIPTNKKVIFIGDSYQANYGNNGWCNKVIANLGLTGAIISSAGGASFGGRTGFDTFEHLLTMAITDLSVDEKNAITDIIVCGGLNDVAFLNEGHTAGEIRTAINSFAYIARTNCPNATVHVGFIGNTVSNTTDIEQVVRLYRNCGALATNLCYITGIEGPMTYKGYFMNDNVHPTDAGLDQIAYSICTYLKNGKAVTNFLLKPAATAESGIGNLNALNDIIEKLYYDTFEMYFPPSWGFDSSSGINFTQNAFVDFATLSNDLLRFSRYPFYINTFAGYQIGNNWTLHVPCVIRFYRNKVGISFFETVNGVNRIAFNYISPIVADIMDACF